MSWLPDTIDAPGETDLAWLAGVLDSEGTVSLVNGPRRNPQLRLSIYNSSDLILDKVAKILCSLNVPYHEHKDDRPARPGYGFHIGTQGAITLYPLLRPFLVRQVNRYDYGYWFLTPRYEGRQRVRWTESDRSKWEQLRQVCNAK
jgi:hypothetical protein